MKQPGWGPKETNVTQLGRRGQQEKEWNVVNGVLVADLRKSGFGKIAINSRGRDLYMTFLAYR